MEKSNLPIALFLFFSTMYLISHSTSNLFEHIHGVLDLGNKVVDNNTNNRDNNNNTGICNQEKYDFKIDNLKDYNNDSLFVDIGCEIPVTTIDIIWKNVDRVSYDYTIQILSGNKSLKKEFNYVSDMLPRNTSQTTGTENTLGQYIKLIINEPSNKEISNSIDNLIISTYGNYTMNKENKEKLWKDMSVDYSNNITIYNSNNVTTIAKLYQIIDGDDVNIINPYFSFNNIQNLRLKNGQPFSIIVDSYHLEGINVHFDSIHSNQITITPSNDTSIFYEGPQNKTFYFTPIYEINDDTKMADKTGNLTIRLDTSSESSVYYKTSASFSN
jgi:hypothetical protein